VAISLCAKSMRSSPVAGASRGKRQRSFVDVDAGHPAAAADQACRNHRQLSHAAADIEHTQTGRKAARLRADPTTD